MIHLITTFFHIGHMRPAPGTWGSLAGLTTGFLLFVAGGWGFVAMLIPLVFLLGWWATARETRGKVDHDPSEIVIDEVVGQWIALLPVLIGASHAGFTGTSALALWPGWIAAFVLFRLFDIWKPSLIGRADRRADALGVMLDDAIAGVAAGLCTAAAAGIAHGLLGL
ncbi:phosphatidylglycerophosphatase A [Aquicoccus sp. G2-2]|uniref:phosphatidylglycerophosphatase A family protein n=1 Tax=Aquicoccus sp. G2-2 TaxID=3092120 RepID=UPI002ADFB7ED|nr:phosphatidylglycerophosphatase A [Aquicoccus sp. G2-2]MEA1113162.1 phosphatidylglycerophosphatase A [Aquicoccus sp. G2-2]